MTRLNKYEVYKSGSTSTGIIINETCITKALKKFIQTLERPANFGRYSNSLGWVKFEDNYTIAGDYILKQC